MKRIAVYLDGTWNGPAADTNVKRLSDATLDDGDTQRVKYLDGVGLKFGSLLVGGLLGAGLSRKVIEAYAWLVRNYEDGDEIFIFGFSRGAYTARSLAGMVARCGLLLDLDAMTADDVYDRYRKGNDVDRLSVLRQRRRDGDDRFSSQEHRLLAHSRVVEIQCIGVWDTVGALGVPFGRIQGLSRVTLFHDTNPSTLYRNMFHALAIDEQRRAFEPTLWTESTKPGGFRLAEHQRLEQVWFAGSHSNVGGGTFDHALSMLTLEWMQARAKECGLVFSRDFTAGQEQVEGRVSDSYGTFLGGAYRFVSSRYERPIGAGPDGGGEQPIDETVDRSVFDRTRRLPDYRPPNLLAWARRHATSPTTHRTDPTRTP